MRTGKILHSASSSSRSWLSRQSNDPYVKARLTHPSAYRSRSAFKLLEIDEQHGLFSQPDVRAVVDLGAAPGGWSQVVADKLGWTEHYAQESDVVKVRYSYGKRRSATNEKYGTWSSPKLEAKRGTRKGSPKENGKWKAEEETGESEVQGRYEMAEGEGRAEKKVEAFDPLNIDNEDPTALPVGRGTIVAMDLLPMDPIHGVLDVQADFLKPESEELIHRLLKVKGNIETKADIILSDMAANLSGNKYRDIELTLEICESVYDFSTRHLRTSDRIGREKGGVLLMKYFAHPLLDSFCRAQLTPNFKEVKIIKPPSSRSESKEGYFLCQGWKGLQ